MKHVITFEEEDLLQYIKDMLAMRGVAPAEDLKIECEQIRPGVEGTGSDDVPGCKTTHIVRVTCKEGSELTHCPMCKHALNESKETEAPLTIELKHREAQEAPEEPEEQEEPRENVVLDESLGESLEPPTPPNRPISREGGGPSIASLRAQSDRVRREREPHLPRRPRGSKA